MSERKATGLRWRQMADGGYYEINYRFDRRTIYEKAGTDFRGAVRLRKQRLAEIAAGTFRVDAKSSRAPLLRDFAAQWLERRGDVRTVEDDRARLELHVLPELGEKRLDAIATADMLDLLATLRAKTSARGAALSKNSIRNIWANVVTLMKEARARGYCDRNPCDDVPESLRPRKAKRHEVQRGYFTESDVERLISDTRIPEDRRAFYALMLLGGFRFGEASGLTWADYQRDAKPLGHIRLTRQWNDAEGCYTGLKGKRNEPGPPRDVPVHPTLAKVLAAWKLDGFAFYLGRAARADDPIVPSRRGQNRTTRLSLRRLREDCERIGITPRTQHECRNTFATLAQAHGAGEAWVRRITHNASGDVLAGYTGDHWPAMCRAVECIPVRLRPPGAEVIAFPRAVGADGFGGIFGVTDDGTKKPRAIAGLSGGADGTRSSGAVASEPRGEAVDRAENAAAKPRAGRIDQRVTRKSPPAQTHEETSDTGRGLAHAKRDLARRLQQRADGLRASDPDFARELEEAARLLAEGDRSA